MKLSTQCVQLGRGDDTHGAIVPPIYQTATFEQPTATEFGEYDYSRSGNPTRTILEAQLAALENAAHARVFSSGMAALTAIKRISDLSLAIMTTAAAVIRRARFSKHNSPLLKMLLTRVCFRVAWLL